MRPVCSPFSRWHLDSRPCRGWSALAVAPCELRLHATLDNGQCFGWRRQPGDENVWVGVLGQKLLALRQTESDCLFRCLSRADSSGHEATAEAEEAVLRDELRDYFQLDTPLVPLYEEWSQADERMATVARALPGMRVLRQEPVECLFSFICSSNNNIARIGGMLQTLRRTYGEPLPQIAAAPVSDSALGFEPVGHGDAPEFFTFPSAERLASASEAELRGLGLGYRAAYVRQTAAAICTRGSDWLPSLRSMREPDTVRSLLAELSGVGPKVADCAALFSLDQAGAIPVDTHVWDIACRDLDPSLTQCGSLTPKVYSRVGELFRGRYGDHAGWAHSLLFAAELPLFKPALPESMQLEMAAFREKSKAARAQVKTERAEAKAAASKGGGGSADETVQPAAEAKTEASPTSKGKTRPLTPKTKNGKEKRQRN